MKFIFNTLYDMEALTVMARAVRKTGNKKILKIKKIYVIVMCVLLVLMTALALLMKEFTFKMFLMMAATIAIFAFMKFEDRFNAFIASKRMLKGAEKGVVTFYDDHYVSETEIGTTDFKYNVIHTIARRGDYIVFVFPRRHAQVYDMRAMINGTPKEFCEFIEEKTGKNIVKI